MVEWLNSKIRGAALLAAPSIADARGEFTKVYHEAWFAERGIKMDLRESYFSRSQQGVLRGMHFQAPPSAGAKLVSCLEGRILDVLVDLRRGADYGSVWTTELSAGNRRVLFVPVGVAHGFVTLDGPALVHYTTDAVYDRENDRGIRWDSINVTWPVASPILSPRDESLPTLAEFETPF